MNSNHVQHRWWMKPFTFLLYMIHIQPYAASVTIYDFTQWTQTRNSAKWWGKGGIFHCFTLKIMISQNQKAPFLSCDFLSFQGLGIQSFPHTQFQGPVIIWPRFRCHTCKQDRSLFFQNKQVCVCVCVRARAQEWLKNKRGRLRLEKEEK